jgi:MFS family permease
MQKKSHIVFLIIVAALGYFVDIYDLTLFAVVKSESLQSIMPGESKEVLSETGKFLFNMQMLGMLMGGLIWGILGDKKGRLKVLFGSILLYSLANLANAFVTDIPTYAVIRIIAGIGLAGELGAGITLISEMMPKEKRGYGTMIIVTFGALGAVVASLVGSQGASIGRLLTDIFGVSFQNWQVAYIIGGILGLMLLLLRVGAIESGFYKEVESNKNVRKGDIRLLFSNKENFSKYIHCIVIGIPVWFVVGLLIMNSENDFAPLLGINGVVNAQAVTYAYIGLSVGDLISGFLSQILKSRKKVVFIYLFLSFVLTVILLFGLNGASKETYYLCCFLLGIATGYWAIFVTIAAEQFGTNIRSTTANTVPNFVRGSVNLITLLFGFLLSINVQKDWSAFIVGAICIGFALFSLSKLKETFGKDLNYLEADHMS